MTGIMELARRSLPTALLAWRELHANPEISNLEFETTAYIEKFLAARGIPHERATSGTGCVASVGEGPARLMLRADIDALPLQEGTGVEFASKNPGVMHACGHDAHAAMLLAAAQALKSGEMPFAGRIVLLFQPAEEGKGGCRTLVRQGLLERYPVKRAFALHVWPGLKVGRVAFSPGPVMAGVNYVHVSFKGSGGHGAYPHLTQDTIAAAAHFISSAQALTMRSVDPVKSHVVTFGAIHGGGAPNVIPALVTVEGTFRAFEEPVRMRIEEGIRLAAKSSARIFGCEEAVTVDEGYIPTVNSPRACAELAPKLIEALGGDAVLPSEPTLGAEDMGFILREVEGCYIRVGAGDTGPGAEQLHSPSFLPSEECLLTGVASMLAAVEAFSPAP